RPCVDLEGRASSRTNTSHLSRKPQFPGRVRPTFRAIREFWDVHDPLFAESAICGTSTTHFSRKLRVLGRTRPTFRGKRDFSIPRSLKVEGMVERSNDASIDAAFVVPPSTVFAVGSASRGHSYDPTVHQNRYCGIERPA